MMDVCDAKVNAGLIYLVKFNIKPVTDEKKHIYIYIYIYIR